MRQEEGNMKKTISKKKTILTTVQLAGIATACVGAFFVAIWLGLLLTGLSMVAVGHLLDRSDDE